MDKAVFGNEVPISIVGPSRIIGVSREAEEWSPLLGPVHNARFDLAFYIPTKY